MVFNQIGEFVVNFFKPKNLGESPKTEEKVQTTKTEHKSQPKLKNLIINLNSPKYPVYLILEDETTLLTFCQKIIKNGEEYYTLAFNKKNYKAKAIEYKYGKLNKNAVNFLFLEDNGNLVRGKGEFSEKAKKQIAQIDQMKLEDRAYERTIQALRTKYGKRFDIEIIITIIILCVGIFIVAYAVFSGLPQVIGQLHNVAAVIVQNPPPVDIPPVVQNITVG